MTRHENSILEGLTRLAEKLPTCPICGNAHEDAPDYFSRAFYHLLNKMEAKGPGYRKVDLGLYLEQAMADLFYLSLANPEAFMSVTLDSVSLSYLRHLSYTLNPSFKFLDSTIASEDDFPGMGSNLDMWTLRREIERSLPLCALCKAPIEGLKVDLNLHLFSHRFGELYHTIDSRERLATQINQLLYELLSLRMDTKEVALDCKSLNPQHIKALRIFIYALAPNLSTLDVDAPVFTPSEFEDLPVPSTTQG